MDLSSLQSSGTSVSMVLRLRSISREVIMTLMYVIKNLRMVPSCICYFRVMIC